MDRAEHRRQLAADRVAFAQGVDVTNRDARLVMALMRVCHELVRTSIARRSLSPLMHYVLDNFSRSASRLPGQDLACRRGCAHCCHAPWVDASAAELVYIAKSLTGARRRKASIATTAAVESTAGLSPDERKLLVTPCPMLEDNACAIYAIRPLVCRAGVSTDAAACERAFIHLSGETVPMPPEFRLIRTDYRLAIAGALRKAGLCHRSIDLRSGLKIALSEPDVERRLLAGEDVFAAAAPSPHDDIFNLPNAEAIYQGAFA